MCNFHDVHKDNANCNVNAVRYYDSQMQNNCASFRDMSKCVAFAPVHEHIADCSTLMTFHSYCQIIVQDLCKPNSGSCASQKTRLKFLE